MSQSFDSTELLIQLGLTLSEAKVFVTLSELGVATAKTISKHSDVPREFTYRILPELHNKGLIEEIVSSPKMFRAIPIRNAYQNLLRDKEKENLNLQMKIEEACKSIPHIEIQDLEEPQIIMIPSGEATRTRIEQEHKNAQKSIDTIIPWKKFPKVAQLIEDIEDTLITKDITIRVLTETKAKETKKYFKFDFNPLLKTRHMNIEYVPSVSSLELVVFDKKKIMFTTSPNKQEKTTWLYSNNPFMVEMGCTYFETLWKSPRQKAQLQ